MDSSELRDKFLKFFEERGHKVIPSASLIPENDPTVLFTTAGMHPLVPYLLGQKHPDGKRLASCQKCIRTGDIEEVGDDTHLTFFEMLGNWSLGDYWKKEAIEWSFEFLTKELKIPLERLAITCFAGDKDAPKDEESAKIWESLGIKKERIAFLAKEDNWWGPAGQTGPCGPDTEMFYWKLKDEPAPKTFDPKDKNWVEIWNDVFMQYVKDENGKYLPAEQKNVDTGMGLERTLAVLNGKESVYETDLFLPIIEKIEELSGKKYEDYKKEFRIIADHIKASVFLAAEGIEPSNKDQGYVLRRLIREAVANSDKLGLESIKTFTILVEETQIMYKNIFSNLCQDINILTHRNKISQIIRDEEIKSREAVKNGQKEFEKRWKIGLSGKDIFDLKTVYSIPYELTAEWARERRKPLSPEIIQDYYERFEKHRELSQTASAGMFKGGLADASEETAKLHTAAHLMLAGLRKVLGSHVVQKGSNITAERLRFDFSHPEKMTKEQIEETENFVNDIIKKDLPVWFEEMPLEKAKELNATGVFESKYGQTVKVYFIGKGDENVSKEICGGPHVEHAGVLGHFKIIKEESSSAGVRRIKAILE